MVPDLNPFKDTQMALQLKKEAETVGLLLTKKGIKPSIQIDVQMLVDVSGSTQDEFDRGLMDEVFQRTLAFANKVDPNGQIEVTAFASRAHDCGQFDPSDFDKFPKEFLRRAKPVLWGGTEYAEGFKSMQTKFEEKAKGVGAAVMSGLKSLFGGGTKTTAPAGAMRAIIFITDGEDFGSERELHSAINTLLDGNTFILALGINSNPSNFRKLEELDKKFDGFSYVHVKKYADLSNDEFYDKLLSDEFVTWLKAKGLAS